jgi:hypothetical protein
MNKNIAISVVFVIGLGCSAAFAQTFSEADKAAAKANFDRLQGVITGCQQQMYLYNSAIQNYIMQDAMGIPARQPVYPPCAENMNTWIYQSAQLELVFKGTTTYNNIIPPSSPSPSSTESRYPSNPCHTPWNVRGTHLVMGQDGRCYEVPD